jgi:hydroxyacylglutathione hydrolase
MTQFLTHLIPCLQDNYAVILHDLASKMTLLIDAPEAAPIEAFLAQKGLTLTHILLTHHHNDHIAGVDALVAKYAPQVLGNKADAHRLPKLSQAITGDFTLNGVEIKVYDTPGHTIGHIVYYFPAQKLLFAGDTLFAGGCGRLFEGTPQAMYAAIQPLKKLPDDVQLYCGHEYTLSNLRFALSLAPDNQALHTRLEVAQAKRAKGEPTIPSLMGEEKATNPYLKAKNADEFAAIRAKKDNYR